MIVKSALTVVLTFLCTHVIAQAPQWVHSIGNTSSDVGRVCHIAPNGNVLIAGEYRGTIDLDPSTGVFNLSSFNNTQDVYVACYTPAGVLQWGFSLGKEDLDGVNALVTDANNNVYIGGYFRGTNVDFDPSSGTATLTCAGNNLGATDWGGDGYVAKYSSTGAYQWAYRYGTQYGRETVDAIAIDNSGNIILSGAIRDVADIDVGAGVTNLNPNTNGTVFLAKYNSSMQLQWGFSLGKPAVASASVDNSIRGVKVDASGNVYITGFVQNDNNLDFDPSSGTASVTVSGLHDGYVAKYTSAGSYVFVFLIGNTGVDDFFDIELDASANIYVTGYSDATSVDFDPTSATAVANAQGGGLNIALASYTSAGAYRWGKLIGNAGLDMGQKLKVAGSTLYVTGRFSGTVNFNPGGTTTNYASAGNTDIFVTAYSLTGVYGCGYRLGSTGVDYGGGITANTSGSTYITGAYSGTVDFDPGTAVLNKASAGSTDAYIGKFEWTAVGSGYLIGDTVCLGEQAYLTYVDTNGGTNVTISYSDGTSNYTKNVTSGVPFAITPNPTTNTTYTFVPPTSLCGSSGTPSVVQVTVNPSPIANAGADVNACGVTTVQLSGSGGGSYTWSSSEPITNPTSPTPTVSGTTSGTYRLIVTNSSGCSDTDDVVVTTLPMPVADAGPDMTVCPTSLVQLNGSGGLTYYWYSTIPIVNPTVQNPLVHAKSGTFYVVVSNGPNCSDTDDMQLTVLPQVTAFAGNDTSVCDGATIQLKGEVSPGAATWKWVSNTPVANPSSLNTSAVVDSTDIFYLVVIDTAGCSDTSMIKVSTLPEPDFSLSEHKNYVCTGGQLEVWARGGTKYTWWGPGFSSVDAGVILKPTIDGTYYVEITDTVCGFVDTFEIPVAIKPLPDVSILKSNDINCAQPFAQLTAQGAATYIWTPATALDNPTKQVVQASPGTTSTYSVTGYSEFGCVGKAEVEVDIKTEDDIQIFIPTAFTPNNDGTNDCMHVKINADFADFKFQIRNRWGEAVYKSTDKNDCWDGTYKGSPAELSTYFYLLQINTAACGTITRKGDILLLR